MIEFSRANINQILKELEWLEKVIIQSVKSYFLQELSRQNRPRRSTQQLLGTIIPLAALGLTLIALILLGPKVGELLKASLLSLPH